MTREEAIKNLVFYAYGECERMPEVVAQSLDMAIEALKEVKILDKIPNNYLYDTETDKCLVYRNKYTGKEIHILKPTDLFVLERPHGEWKEFTVSTYRGTDEWGEPIWGKGKKFICERCGRRTVIRENFCPNCGADMRKEGGEK